jgi:hypothetical protein
MSPRYLALTLAGGAEFGAALRRAVEQALKAGES